MRPAPLDFDSLHAALRAAGEGTRLRVLALLAEADLTVSDLTKILRQSQPRISRHLKLLVEAGLVERLGHDVHVVLGSERNIKITRPADMELAHFYLESERKKA